MTRKLCLFLLVALVGTMAACSGDEKASVSTSDSATSTATPAEAATGGATPEGETGSSTTAATPESGTPAETATPAPTTTATEGDRLKRCKSMIKSITPSPSKELQT